MSVILPNGNRTYPTPIPDVDEIDKCLRQRRSIVVTSRDFHGIEATSILWHSEDPVVAEIAPKVQLKTTLRIYG
ncbi:hypothetical protein HYPP_01557 [Hyphomicrobium sp. ghe19]|nr:hypothetical protein HYPP_01557 [Hyphomicrobium sp. ghe19]